MLVTSDITHMRLVWRVDGEGASCGVFHIILYYVTCSIYKFIMSNTTYITCITYILLIYITYITCNSQPFPLPQLRSPSLDSLHSLACSSLAHPLCSSRLAASHTLESTILLSSCGPSHFLFSLSVRFFPHLFAN